jgi:MarR family transcriptional regulator for hemolysin
MMTATTPERTVPDLSFLLAHASHVLATRMTAALTEIGMTPRGHCVLVHALGAELTQIELARLTDLDKTTMVMTLDRVHHEVLQALPAGEQATFMDALTRLVSGHLATPVESTRPVRRARQSRS